MKTYTFILPIIIIISILSVFIGGVPSHAAYHFEDFVAQSPIHIFSTTGKVAVGITPTEIKKFYNLPLSGGTGTIVIIGAYNDVGIEKDLADFDSFFQLPACTTKNKCLTRHVMGVGVVDNSAWDLETALDVEWAHAIAPTSKILLVEASTASGKNLLAAVDYAAKQKDVKAVSMSWGGAEFPEEVALDTHFTSVSKAAFFASSGDSGAGASWPASSPKVIAVGGTSIILTAQRKFLKETAWIGSGGGVSAYEKEPGFQSLYSIPKAHGMRAVPDVAYNADPASGFPIVHGGVWRTAGGTSAGAPQWAAIATLGKGAANWNFYTDKSSVKNGQYFRDVTSGTNGSCGFYCNARARYDYLTGLGTPQTTVF
jgi:subtilase family serine protease